ncbi:hypothetical protein [Nonomuraea sp. LPB2021202275-12-8]|uniref:hypothetical protein n=1 Tax=Nonomuraea sp. LPB2021202275-12-8 TaxID=3120159 RepID=UPI00300D6AAC
MFLPDRVLRALHHYIEIERDELVQRRRAQGTFTRCADALMVRRAGRHALFLEGRRGSWSYSKITIEERRRLVRAGEPGDAGEPLWLWLGDDGQPLRASTWQSAFLRANERCAKFELGLEFHPHMLRHVYAVHMLGLLLRQTVRALGQREDRRLTSAEVKRLLIGNPIRKLQMLLGHAQESTVYLYLDVLDEAQEIVLAALAEWDAQVAVLEQVKANAGEDE